MLVDCRPDTLNLDSDQLEQLIAPQKKAIILVHFDGLRCEMDRILEIAKTHNLQVIEAVRKTVKQCQQ